MPFDYRQRYEDPQEALRVAMGGNQQGIWTALPGIVQSYDENAITVTVQPTHKELQTGPDLSTKAVQLPIIPDVPVHFPRGGGVTMTMPIEPGDECIIIFSCRSIDQWWDQGGIQAPTSLRMHDINDAFAIVGVFSQPNKIDKISKTTVQLRSNELNSAGTAAKIFVEIDVPNTKAQTVVDQVSCVLDGNANTVAVKASTSVTLDTPLVHCTGALHADGEVVAQASGAGVTVSQHKHGTGNPAAGTVPPTAGT